MKAQIIRKNDNLMIEANGEPLSPAAYMSYLENNADYGGFKKVGYSLFCACVYMGDCTINEISGVRPFNDHVWKARGVYDFTPVYDSLKKIVGEGKEKAYVMLRVNLNAPLWWRVENPDECTVLSDGKAYMQSIFSKKWLEDAKVFLEKLCAYVHSCEFSENVVAVQVAGMQTEEWLALRTESGCFDYSTPAKNAYTAWLESKDKNTFNAYLPTSEDLKGRHQGSVVDNKKYQSLIDYLQFFNEGYASTIKALCAHVKEVTRGDLLVGVFYGYVGVPCDFGQHAISTLFADKNIDFFASPFAYVNQRQGAMDWFFQGVMDSCRLAGKIWFMEADVRTHKTEYLFKTNPELMEGERTVDYFDRPIFLGPPTEQESKWVLLRAFGKALCAKSAFWWFDMWGGWYNSPSLMSWLEKARAWYEKAMGAPIKKTSEIAVFFDENAGREVSEEYYYQAINNQLIALGTVGAPHDIYLTSDHAAVDKTQHKAQLYMLSKDSSERKNVLVCKGERIEKSGYFTAEEISAFLQKAGGHVFSEGNIVHANARYVSLTATKEGEVTLYMPKTCKLKAFSDGKIYQGQEFTFSFAYNQTELFEVIE